MTERKTSRMLKWADDMIENLVKSLQDLTTKLNFGGLNMDGEKPFQYTDIKKVMNAIYNKQNISSTR